MKDLFEYQKDWIWIEKYPVHYAGVDFNSRMKVIRLLNNNLLIHSPCEIDRTTQLAIECATPNPPPIDFWERSCL